VSEWGNFVSGYSVNIIYHNTSIDVNPCYIPTFKLKRSAMIYHLIYHLLSIVHLAGLFLVSTWSRSLYLVTARFGLWGSFGWLKISRNLQCVANDFRGAPDSKPSAVCKSLIPQLHIISNPAP
jgi:hypothetical protein